MAVVDHRGTGKENVPPPAAVAARHHGVAVKKLKLKRLGRARRRVPLRDITNLFVAAAADADSAAEHADAGLPPPASPPAPATTQNWLAGGVTLKPGRYSLRKEFR